MRQVFIVGDGPGVLSQAQSLMSLGWAVTAAAWASAATLQPEQVLIANVTTGREAPAYGERIRGWSRSAAVVVVVERIDTDTSNEWYRAGATAVLEGSVGAAMVGELAQRLCGPAPVACAGAGASLEEARLHVEALPDAGALTMGEDALLQALLRGVGKVVSYEHLFQALEYAGRDATRKRRALAAQVVRLRKKLRATQYRIRSRNNGGYALMPPRPASSGSGPIPLSEARRRRAAAAASPATP